MALVAACASSRDRKESTNASIQPVTTTMSCDTPLFTSGLTFHDYPVTGTSMDDIRTAISSAVANGTQPVRVTVPAGVYTGDCLHLDDILRTATTPLWLQGSGAELACTNGDFFIDITHSSYIRISGFTFGPSATTSGPRDQHSGVHVAGRALNTNLSSHYGEYQETDHVIVDNNVFRNLNEGCGTDAADCGEVYQSQKSDAVKSNQSSYVWILDNQVSRTSRHGFDSVGVHHLAVCRNQLTDMFGEGFGMEAKGGSSDVLFERNSLRNVRRRAIVLGGEGTDAIYMHPYDANYEGLNEIARNNKVVDPGEAGIAFHGCQSCTAAGNSVWLTAGSTKRPDFVRFSNSATEGSTDYWGGPSSAYYPKTLPSDQALLVDNLFGTADAGALNPSVDPYNCDVNRNPSATGSLSYSHNAWWNGGSALPYCEAHDGYITSNPQITSAGTPSTAPNLVPLSTSPLIGAGVANEALDSVDYNGATRPNPPSIGAYESASSGGTDAGTDSGGTDSGSGGTCSGSGLLDGNFESCQPASNQVGGVTAPWQVVSSGGSGVKVNTDYCTSSPCYYRSATHNGWAGCGFGGVQGLKQRVTGLSANTNYTFSFYARPSSNMVHHGQLAVKTTTGTSLVTKTFGASTGADFNLTADQYGTTPVSGTFCTGSNTSVDVFGQIDCTASPAINSGGFEMDDFALVAGGACSGGSGTATIAQPGYEEVADSSGIDVSGGTNASLPWKRVGCDYACYVERIEASGTPLIGNRSVTVTCGNDGTTAATRSIRQLVTGTAGTSYTVKVSVRNDSGSGGYGFVRVTNSSGTQLAAVTGIDDVGTVEKTLTFTAPTGGTFYLEGGVTCAGYSSRNLTIDGWSITSP